jgi:hypothetical protein
MSIGFTVREALIDAGVLRPCNPKRPGNITPSIADAEDRPCLRIDAAGRASAQRSIARVIKDEAVLVDWVRDRPRKIAA